MAGVITRHYFMHFLCRLLVLFTTLMTPATAATIRVGPSHALTRISDAARSAKDGDVIEIEPGTYHGDVAIWPQKALTIKGLGTGAEIDAGGQVAAGKAIWVIPEGRFRVSNITFRGARAPDRNGAGIRLEHGALEIDDCRFEDNQIGVLTSNFPDAELTIRDSIFSHAPHQTDSLPHLLYAGRIGKLTVTGTRFHGGYHGHLIKSRAQQTTLAYNFIFDGPTGEASYEVDLPSGGDALLIGNIIGQSGLTQNPIVVAYGAEETPWSTNRLRLSHNTLISDARPGAAFLRMWAIDGPRAELIAVNNLTVGLGVFTLTNDGAFTGNRPALAPMLRDPETLDFRLPTDSLLSDSLDSADQISPDLVPTAQFLFPLGTIPLSPRSRWSPGALQQ